MTFLLVDNNLCGKLVRSSELPIIFDDCFETTSVSFFNYEAVNLIALLLY